MLGERAISFDLGPAGHDPGEISHRLANIRFRSVCDRCSHDNVFRAGPARQRHLKRSEQSTKKGGATAASQVLDRAAELHGQERNEAARPKNHVGFLRYAPKALDSAKAGFPESDPWFQLRRLPEGPLGSAPGGIRSRNGRQFIFSARALLEISGAQIFNQNAQAPAIRDRMVNREYHQLVVGSTAQNVESVEG